MPVLCLLLHLTKSRRPTHDNCYSLSNFYLNDKAKNAEILEGKAMHTPMTESHKERETVEVYLDLSSKFIIFWIALRFFSSLFYEGTILKITHKENHEAF